MNHDFNEVTKGYDVTFKAADLSVLKKVMEAQKARADFMYRNGKMPTHWLMSLQTMDQLRSFRDASLTLSIPFTEENKVPFFMGLPILVLDQVHQEIIPCLF